MRTNLLTHSQGHDPQFVPDETHHLALLKGRGSAANDSFAATAELQQVVLQLLLQGPVQCTAIYNQDKCRGQILVTLCCTSFGVADSSMLHFQLQLL